MGGIIDAAFLTEMQGLTEGAMPDTITIERYGPPEADEGGGQVPGTPETTVVMGRISPLRSVDLEAERAGQLAQDGVEVLRVPLDADVENTDTVIVDSARHNTVRRYTVEGVLPLSSYAVHRKILVKPVLQ